MLLNGFLLMINKSTHKGYIERVYIMCMHARACLLTELH